MNTDCCCPQIIDPAACGCCDGVQVLTPLPTVNRPGLPALSYRIGTHGSFLETMKARLSGNDYPALNGLSTRASEDPAIALLDAWATVADVLTFYQERIANEGFLRTATERRSVLELGRLVGYQPRPGVSSSVYLAYTVDDNTQDEVTIPQGSRSQSLPGPGEVPQSFETDENLKARASWNNLKPRMTRPQSKETIDPTRFRNDGTQEPRVYLKGVGTGLKPNDALLIDFGSADATNGSKPVFYRVKAVKPEPEAKRTLVTLQHSNSIPTSGGGFANSAELIKQLTAPPSVQVANRFRLPRTLTEQFSVQSFVFPLLQNPQGNGDTALAETNDQENQEKQIQFSAVTGTAHALTKQFSKTLENTLAKAAANANVTPQNPIKVYALRVKAAPFGHNAPLRPVRLNANNVMEYGEWTTENPLNDPVPVAFFRVASSEVQTGESVTFINNSSGKIDKVLWTVGGPPVSGTWNLTHTFKQHGTYTVSLTVFGPGGESKPFRATITVSDPIK